MAKRTAQTRSTRSTPKSGKPSVRPTKPRQNVAKRPRTTTRQSSPEFFRASRLMDADDLPTYDEAFNEVNDLKQRMFLQAYARTGRIDASSKAANVTPATTWNWRHDPTDTAFLAAFERAHALAVESGESELWRRGFKGVEKPVFHKGQLVATVRDYDTQAAMFMMRGARPDKYRDNVHHSGAPALAIDVHVGALSDADLEARFERLASILRPQIPLPATIDATAVVADSPDDAYARALAARKPTNGNGHNGNGSNGNGNGHGPNGNGNNGGHA